MMNTFVPGNFAAHVLQIPACLKQSVGRYLFVFFQLSNVDVFTDIADSCDENGIFYESLLFTFRDL